MGKVTYATGSGTVSMSALDRGILIILIVAAIESVIYYADYWFFGGHRINWLAFALLSYAVFREIFRSVASWIFFLFIRIPRDTRAVSSATVDVLTTAMPGEPYEMFEKTLTAIARMQQLHTAYLLDGGYDTKLHALCEKLGVQHVDCRGISGAKGGKINHCLKNYSQSEFVLIIDPDHIPQPDFIERVVPCFLDEKVGFVQVVQAYYNQDASIVAKAAAEQTYGFYGPLQMGLHGLNMPIAIGANCTFRRKALDSIGGHAIHLAEDACTSLRLHAQGWKSKYVPYRASHGLVPEDLTSFFKQQLKWASGMFALFTGEYFKRAHRLSLAGRIYYFFAGTFYLTGIATALTLILPAIFLFGKFYAIEMPIAEFFAHSIPYVLLSLIVTFYIQRWYTDAKERTFPWRSMVLEKGSWHIYTLSFIFLLLNKKVPYVPTPKNGAQHTSIWVIAPNLIMILLNAAAVAFALCTYPRFDAGTILMILFSLVNIAVLTPVCVWGLTPLKVGKV